MERDDLYRTIFLTSGIHINLKRNIEKILAPFTLTFTQFGVLESVAGAGPSSQKCIAGLLDTDTTTVAVVVDSLEKKELARRKENPADRRSKLVSLTVKGNRVLEQATGAVLVYKTELMGKLRPAEIKAAVPFLESMYSFLKKTGR